MTEPIFDLVIADLRAREAQGAETYGKARMEAHDGRDSLQDAYEEALDLAVYLRKAIAERDAMVAAVVEQVEAGRYVGVAENVIESDEDYARRMGWWLDTNKFWYREGLDTNKFWYREGEKTMSWTAIERLKNGWRLWIEPMGAESSWYPTLRAAVDAYEAQSGKTLAQALAEVGEDDPA